MFCGPHDNRGISFYIQDDNRSSPPVSGGGIKGSYFYPPSKACVPPQERESMEVISSYSPTYPQWWNTGHLNTSYMSTLGWWAFYLSRVLLQQFNNVLHFHFFFYHVTVEQTFAPFWCITIHVQHWGKQPFVCYVYLRLFCRFQYDQITSLPQVHLSWIRVRQMDDFLKIHHIKNEVNTFLTLENKWRKLPADLWNYRFTSERKYFPVQVILILSEPLNCHQKWSHNVQHCFHPCIISERCHSHYSSFPPDWADLCITENCCYLTSVRLFFIYIRLAETSTSPCWLLCRPAFVKDCKCKATHRCTHSIMLPVRLPDVACVICFTVWCL